MEIRILQLLEGARQARGLTVIIDVFRAFSAECCMFAGGAARVLAVGSVEDAFRLKRENPGSVLCGERWGKMCEGFDVGNSPSVLRTLDLRGRTVVHTTSSGTQGLINARGADELITGSLNNAAAVAGYIKMRNPQTVSLVCMGIAGLTESEEDTLCAEYIRSLLLEESFPYERRVAELRHTSGAKFFDPAQQDVFPQKDFDICIQPNLYPFVLCARPFEKNFSMEKRNLETIR